MILDRIIQQFNRVQVYLTGGWFEILIELLVIWVLVLVVLRFLRGTRGARVIKGVVLVLIIATLAINLGAEKSFERIRYLYTHFLNVVTLSLVIVFQPEIRQALVRLGEAGLFRRGSLRRARVIEELLGTIDYLSKNKVGALIAMERKVGLRGLIDAGTRLDAMVTRALLNTIFWPGSALHDMGVVIRGDRVVAAGVQFPLAEAEQINQELGARHRAAVGLSQESDALVLVVSEETGIVSIAERGRLVQELTVEQVRVRLIEGLGETQMPEDENTNGAQTAAPRSQ